MKEIFGEETKKKKAGIRLVREELFKIVFGVEATESTSEELEKAFDIYLSNNEDFVSTLSESQLKFLQTSVKGISENYDNIKDTIKGFNMILDGELDHLPEAAFNLKGTIEEVIEAGEKMLAEAQAS